jgi:hypothetical protein
MIYQTKIDAARNMARHYVFDAQRSRFGAGALASFIH